MILSWRMLEIYIWYNTNENGKSEPDWEKSWVVSLLSKLLFQLYPEKLLSFNSIPNSSLANFFICSSKSSSKPFWSSPLEPFLIKPKACPVLTPVFLINQIKLEVSHILSIIKRVNLNFKKAILWWNHSESLETKGGIEALVEIEVEACEEKLDLMGKKTR